MYKHGEKFIILVINTKELSFARIMCGLQHMRGILWKDETQRICSSNHKWIPKCPLRKVFPINHRTFILLSTKTSGVFHYNRILNGAFPVVQNFWHSPKWRGKVASHSKERCKTHAQDLVKNGDTGPVLPKPHCVPAAYWEVWRQIWTKKLGLFLTYWIATM